jgi:hypothetical protein
MFTRASGHIVMLVALGLLLGPSLQAESLEAPGQSRTADAVAGLEVPPPEVVQELTMRGGSRLLGHIERIEGGHVAFRTTAGALLEIEQARIIRVRRLHGTMVHDTFWPDDPNPTRLFFAPTGRSVSRGEGYVGVFEVFIPFVQVGVTDRLSIGGGTPLWFGDGGDRPYWLTPKVQVIATRRTQAAIGAMHVVGTGSDHFGVAFAVATHGTADDAVTAGVGYIYSEGPDNDAGVAIAMIGGEHRLSRSVKLITENYAGKHGGVCSGGIRFMAERFSADFGLVVPITDHSVVFPVVNLVWRF